jgi:8-oxo-dGTP pyrophosphatase MutT (NUDIX family)
VEEPAEHQLRWRRAAVYVVCRDDEGRILLTRFLAEDHPDSGRWTMPGGGMEWGETTEQTALRELEEETGLRARLGAVIGVFSHWFTAEESARGEAGHVIGVVYEGTDVTGELRTTFDEGTTDAAAWFSLDEAHSLARVDLVDFVLARVT